MHRTTLLRSGAVAALTALLLAGCGSESSTGDDAGDGGSSSSPAADAAPAADETSALSLEDPYVKAADSGMTAVFGTLVSDGDSDVTVMSAASDISPVVELHETVDDGSGAMTMQLKDGGFTVPAGGTHELIPGGDHIMVMDLVRPVKAGDDVTVTLTLDDGSTLDVVAAVKDVAGGDEKYSGGMDMGADMGSDMGSDTSSPATP